MILAFALGLAAAAPPGLGAAGGGYVESESWSITGVPRPERLRIGADGRWTIVNQDGRVARLTPDGAVVPGALPAADDVLDADAAPDGTLYTTDGGTVAAWSPAGELRWRSALGGADGSVTGLVFDVRAGSLVALDAATPAVIVVSADGRLGAPRVFRDPDADTAGRAVWNDIDVDTSGHVYVLDRGNRRVVRLAPDGSRLVLPVDGPARRIAARGDGLVFTLDMDGWVRWYTPSAGRLGAFDAARWHATARPSPADLAVDGAGRVAVVDRAAAQLTRFARASGTDEPTALSSGAAGCRIVPDKRITPGVIALGESAQVRLIVRGTCGSGSLARPLDVAVLMSPAAAGDPAVAAATAAALNETIDAVDLGAIHLAIVGGPTGARGVPAAATGREDHARRAARRLAGAEPRQDDDGLAAVLADARAALGGRRRPEALAMALVIGSSGEPPPSAAVLRQAQALKDAGVLVWIVAPGDVSHAFAALATDPEHVWRLREGDGVAVAVRGVLADVGAAMLLRRLDVEDRLAPGFRFDSAPGGAPVRYDAASHTVRIEVDDVPLPGIAVDYSLEPRSAGTGTTSLAAWGDFVDHVGRVGRAAFPAPAVSVLAAAVPTTPSPSPGLATPAPSPPVGASATPHSRGTRAAFLPHAFRAELPAAPAAEPCLSTEREPNDVPEEALRQPPLCAGSRLSGSLPSTGPDGAPDVDDYFRVEVGAVVMLDASLEDIAPGTNADLFLYDCNAQPGHCRMLARSQSDSGRERILLAVSAGRYYLRVWLRPGSPHPTTPYTLHWVLGTAADP